MKWAALGVLVLLLLSACVHVTDRDGKVMEYAESSFIAVDKQVVEDTVKVMVKGSIYETGEQVSVFGTCLNSTDGGIIGSTAVMNSWYPNGTVFFQNVSMTVMDPGYFVYSGYMSAVPGTYLTEFVCTVPGGAQAKAFGEWQNPQWVRKISEINDTTADLYNETLVFQNLTNQWFEFMMGQLANISVQVNYTYINLTSQITEVGQIANASVDRNDSYLANLLEGVAVTVGAPISGLLQVEEDYERARYLKDWRIEAIVRNEYNSTVGYPPVRCLINTSNAEPTINAEMTFAGNSKTLLFDQTAKNHYYYVEKVKTTGDWNWTIGCYYVTP